MYIERDITGTICSLAKQFPAVTITGPRQSGKTTLSRHCFKNFEYFSLESPDIRARAQRDPRSFLLALDKGMIIDEVQRVPSLLEYLQEYLDEQNRPGMVVLTGSAQFELLSYLSQSLAGRTGIARLLPLSLNESLSVVSDSSLEEFLYRGFYPRIYDQKMDPSQAMSAYCTTYLERDVRSIANVRDLSLFSTFLRLCAGRTGGILNMASLSNDSGINHTTIRQWLSILEASYLVILLRPHFKNFGKRLVKSPKLHFLDCGLVTWLLEARDPVQLRHHPLFGSVFESFVVSEVMKQKFNAGQESNLYYWRSSSGHEIDLLLDFGTVQLPIEIKSGATVASDFVQSINVYRKINPNSKKAVVVYGGTESYVEDDIWFLGWRELGKLASLDASMQGFGA